MRWLDSITHLMDMKMSKLMSVELARPSNHLILCRPLLLLSWGYTELDTTKRLNNKNGTGDLGSSLPNVHDLCKSPWS